MTRRRIVIDTNVVISAAVRPDGTQAQVIELVALRVVELCVSSEILAASIRGKSAGYSI